MRRKFRVLGLALLGGICLLCVATVAAGAQDGTGVVSITPCVVLDTGQGVGGFSGPLEGAASLDAQVSGAIPNAQGGASDCGVPAGASGVVVDVTAVSPLRAGNLRVFPTGVPSTGGVVNFAAQTPDLDNSNAVVVPLSAAGQVTVVVNAGGSTAPTVDVRLTVIGYLDPSGLRYHPVTPCAVFDSRPTHGAGSVWDGPFVGSESRTIDLVGGFDILQGGGEGNCGIPNSADAVFVNLVALNADGQGRFGVRAAGDSNTTTYTSYAGLTPTMNNANAVIVPLSPSGELDVFSIAGAGNQANGRVVVLGYLDAEGDPFVPVSPCAAFDSRSNHGATGGHIGPFDGDEIVSYHVAGQLPAAQGGGGNDCAVPVGASAVLMNLVAINPVREGNLRVNAVGTVPSGGVVNFAALDPAMNNSNAVAVPLSIDGRIEVGVNAGSVGVGQPASHVRGVILGYYLDENRELSVEITTPEEGPIADRPTTIAGVATDDVGVVAVDLEITDAVTGRFLALCSPNDYCWLSLTSPPALATELDDPGAIGSGFSFGAVDLDAGGSGSYRVTAIVRDADGNEAEDATFFRTTAVSPPVVALTAPADGATVESQATLWASVIDEQDVISVSAVVQDVNSGAYLQQFGDGSQAWVAQAATSVPFGRVAASTSWASVIRAPDSIGRTVRIVSLTAGDAGGSSNTIDPGVTFTIGEDDVAPTVAITSPGPNQTIPQPITLTGTAFDAAGVEQVEVLLQDANLGVYWDGTNFVTSPVWITAEIGALVVSDASWTRSLPASLHDPFGSVNFFVTARATDVQGNQATSDQVLFSTTVDTQAPTVSLVEPSSGLVPNRATTLSGFATDNTGVASVSVSIFDPVTNTYWAEPGWVSSVVDLEAVLEDPFAPLTGWSLEIFAPNDGSGSGTYEVTIRSVDLAGLVASVTEPVNVDEVDPVVTLTSPEDDDAVFDVTAAKFIAEATDAAGIETVEFEIRDVGNGPTRWWDGTTWSSTEVRVPASVMEPIASGFEFEYSSSLPGGSGAHTVRAHAVDGSGNEGESEALDFFADSAVPTISFVGPSTGLSSPFLVSVNAADDIGVVAVTLEVVDTATGRFFNGSAFVSTATTLAVPNRSSLTIDPDWAGGSGSYTVTARAIDGLGKTGSAERTFATADSEAPVAMIILPGDGALVDDPAAIVGTASDNRPVTSIEIEIREWVCGARYFNGSSWVGGVATFAGVIDSGSGTGDVTWTGAIDLGGSGGCGSYRARVRAFDAAGNSQYSAAIFFDTDTENPTVSIDQPTGPTTTAPFDLFISFADDNPGVEVRYTIQDTGSNLYWSGDDFVAGMVELTYSGLTEIFSKGDVGTGEYKITVWAIDAVGNRSADDSLVIEIVP